MKVKRYLIKKRSEFPKCIRHFKEVKGICVGGCVYKSLTKINMFDPKGGISAHTHCLYSKKGWICLEYKFQLKEKLTLLHEVAHLIANKKASTPHHGKKWRKAVVKIGGTFKPYWSHNNRYLYKDFSRTRK